MLLFLLFISIEGYMMSDTRRILKLIYMTETCSVYKEHFTKPKNVFLIIQTSVEGDTKK